MIIHLTSRSEKSIKLELSLDCLQDIVYNNPQPCLQATCVEHVQFCMVPVEITYIVQKICHCRK